MTTQQPQTIYLKDYAQPNFLIESIVLDFDLYESHTRVVSKMTVCRNQVAGKHHAPLILDGEELKLIRLLIDGKKLDNHLYSVSERHLTIQTDLDTFELEIETEIYPQDNTTLNGLYRTNGLFCTQCEAQGFRRMMYYLDRPDVMAPFTTTIRADKKAFPVLLSNGNLVKKGEKGDRHWVTWQDPFKKPAYLFALVAGDLAKLSDTYTTASGRDVSLVIYSEPENIEQCYYAMQSLKNAMQWDEENYGLEYDLDIYMIVAVNDFNMGAMENKGLNVFNAKYVLADERTATDQDFTGVELVVGHEYFHNWTGNRVTLRDWFQLSLKEGLTVFREQQFSQDRGSRVVKRLTDVKHIRTRQYAEDAGPIAHPVRPESYIEINNFYTMTVYYKGAEVIRMLNTLLGPKRFRKGMDLYFSRHDGQAVTIEHFVQAMNDANDDVTNIDFNQFMLWYTQAGTPTVSVSQEQASNGDIIFTFEQSCASTPNQPLKKPFMIPIKCQFYQPDGQQIDLSDQGDVHHTEAGEYVVLTDSDQQLRITAEKLTQKNPKLIPSLLGDYSAPVKCHYAYELEELAFLIKHDVDGFNRWDNSQTLYSRLIKDYLAQGSEPTLDSLPDAFVSLYDFILQDQKTDPALLAEIITLPSFYYIGEQLSVIEVEKLNRILRQLKQIIAQRFEQSFATLYHACCEQDTGAFEPNAIGWRALKNSTLSWLARSQRAQYLSSMQEQYHTAQNMTDRMGALTAVNHAESDIRTAMFDDFYQQFKHEPLVVDKWLGLQACSELPDTLATIQSLTKHEAFDLRTPNKVYALFRNFSTNNPSCFHQADGQGYQCLADLVIQLNQQNPQVAARMVEPLSHFKRYDQKHSGLMKAALEHIQVQGHLSEDVFEIVSKSLA